MTIFFDYLIRYSKSHSDLKPFHYPIAWYSGLWFVYIHNVIFHGIYVFHENLGGSFIGI